MLTVYGPNDQQLHVEAGTTVDTALTELGLKQGMIVVGRANGELVDLDRPVEDGWHLEAVRADEPDGLFVIRHSCAHVMAQAVTDLWPGTHFGIGPSIEDGFYYDFDPETPFTDADFEAIEAKMMEICKAAQTFRRVEVSTDEALNRFGDNPYKYEIITDGEAAAEDPNAPAAESGITIYENVTQDGDVAWADLCRGPHVPSTKWIPAFQLMRTAGAYWRGNSDNKMLSRIYGTAWAIKKDLKAYLHRLEEARKRDHRKLGRELDLLSFPEELGVGLAVWHPNGAIVRTVVEDYIRNATRERGYLPVYTPHIGKSLLWETSGHLDFYADGMYPAMEMDKDADGKGTDYYAKPMNCPFHVLVYRSNQRSYRDLPLRLAELGTVYRYELSGAVHGTMRARGFTQDDSHIFCTEDQVVDEAKGCIAFALQVYKDFGFGAPTRIALSTRPAKAETVGSDEGWAHAENALRQAMDESGLDYVVDEGEGAFYGPKIDMQVTDAIGRAWQLTTVQIDFNLPERFDLSYIGPDGEQHRPYMVHRALLGSVDRFLGVLTEHYAGAFPTWLAPTQVVVIPISDELTSYGDEIVAALNAVGVRAKVDTGSDSMGKKIRYHQGQKVPYMLIVGAQERDNRTVSIRPRYGDQRKDVPLAAFTDELVAEIAAKGVGPQPDPTA